MAASLSPLGPTKVVFIAEDDADFRAALGATLTEAGLRVVLFPTADKLLGSLDRVTPAVIITDVSMPGLSGPELLHRLRLDERLQRIPVVVMTANNDTALPIRLNVPVVYKPHTEGLVAVIQRLPTADLKEEDTMTRYTLPDLPYAYDALKPHISAEIMELHHDKHHRAYVDGANKAIEKLIDGRSRRDYSNLATLEQQLAFNVSGHILHSIFWRNLTPKGGAPGPGLTAAIERDFGSLVAFQEHLVQAASTIIGIGLGSSRLGSGFSAFGNDPDLRSPVERHTGRNPSHGGRCLGACLLPPVPNEEGGLLRRPVQPLELERRRVAIRTRALSRPRAGERRGVDAAL